MGKLFFFWLSLLFPLVLTAQYTGMAPYAPTGGGLIINEVSNGPAGSGNVQEYIELVVTGAPDDPTAPVDLRGWILDDNNFAGSAQGNAQGHLLFGDCYDAVPPGSIIVIFNNFDPNPALPPADPDDTNPADGVYVIPHNDPCIDGCNSNPSTSSSLYCPCTDPASDLFSWQIGLRNPGDVIQVRDACETVVHAIYWGGVSVTPEIADGPVAFSISDNSQSDRLFRLVHTFDDNWLDPDNFDNPFVTGNETPGLPNNAANAAFIQALATGTFSFPGEIADCNQTDAGDLTLPADAPGNDLPLLLCLGNDLGSFGVVYTQPDETEPFPDDFSFEYAFILTQNDAPEYSIVDFQVNGDFDLAALDPGEYLVWGFSYIQTNGSVSIIDFLETVPASIADIQNYAACGFDGDLDNLTTGGEPVLLTILPAPAASPAFIPAQCGDAAGMATFDLTLFNESVNGGTGQMVTWYEGPLPLSPIPAPFNYQTSGGSIYAVVSNGTCESPPVNIPITVIPPLMVEAVPQDISCFGAANGAITVTVVNGMEPLTFNWSADELDGLSNPTGLEPGDYDLTVTDVNGCTGSTAVSITEPSVLKLICSALSNASSPGQADGAGTAAWEGGSPPYSLSWTGPVSGSLSADNDGNSDLTNLPAGDYQLLLTDARGCEETCSFTIANTNCGLDLSLAVDSIDCAGGKTGALTLVIGAGTPPYSTPQWSNGASGLSIAELSAGTYGVTATDATGCSDSLNVMLADPEPLAISFSTQDPTCFGRSDGQLVIEDVSGGSSPYQWRLDPATPELITTLPLASGNLAAGSYDLVIEDARGCLYQESFSLLAPPQLTVDLGGDQILSLGESVLLSVEANFTPDSLNWLPDTLAGTPVLIQPVTTTSVTVTAFDANGCSASDQIELRIDASTQTYVPNAFSPNGDGINDRFTLFSGNNVRQIKEVRIFDRWGEPVYFLQNFQPNDELLGWDGNFRGLEAPTGTYVYFFEIELLDGRLELVTGEVTLLR